MAAFQGHRFIAAQIGSILDQLSENDEVIVVDDHSSDGTPDKVRSLSDPRIRLVESPTNQGIAKTFEEALSRASGSVIFLSDQDDIWMPGKVEKVLRAFESNPNAALVVSDALLVDEANNPLGASYYQSRGSSSAPVFLPTCFVPNSSAVRWLSGPRSCRRFSLSFRATVAMSCMTFG